MSEYLDKSEYDNCVFGGCFGFKITYSPYTTPYEVNGKTTHDRWLAELLVEDDESWFKTGQTMDASWLIDVAKQALSGDTLFRKLQSDLMLKRWRENHK